MEILNPERLYSVTVAVGAAMIVLPLAPPVKLELEPVVVLEIV